MVEGWKTEIQGKLIAFYVIFFLYFVLVIVGAARRPLGKYIPDLDGKYW